MTSSRLSLSNARRGEKKAAPSSLRGEGYPVPLLPSAVLAFFILAASPARAVEPGTAGAGFLKFAVGPRAVGMGESQTAVAEDAYAAYWNPAGLALVAFPQLAATYNRSFAGVDHQYLSLAWPLRAGSTLNVNFTRLGVAALDGFDAQGTRTGGVEAGAQALGVGYGRTLAGDGADLPQLSAGLGLKGVRESLAGASAQTVATDLGLLAVWRPDQRGWAAGSEWRLGFSALNLGPGLKFDAETSPLPTAYRLGLAWRTRPRGDILTLSADPVLSRDEAAFVAFGAEYAVWRVLALRLGYRTGQEIGTGFRGGVGFKLKAVEIDYAFAPFGELGQMHRLGLTVRLGGAVETTPPEERLLSTVLERGHRLFKEGRYYEALLEYDRALGLDLGNRSALEGMRRANERLEK